ncbi:MAG: DUF4291 domain-containing protein [Chloroflexota bacterium]
MTKQILAAYDDEGVYVYQAFRPEIVQAALQDGTFGGGGFKMERMTWIKPSFGWMLYRAGYAMKEHQQNIVKIKLSHAGFRQALKWGVLSTWNPNVYESEGEWQRDVKKSPVRIQWDPDRSLKGGKIGRRAIQIGLRGKAVYAYINEWIIGLEDVTALAHRIGELKRAKKPIEVNVPDERVYPVEAEIMHRLGMDSPG